jgi:hypothetical protein
MNKLLDVEDILTYARDHIECVFMAAGQLPREEGCPIQVERISRVRGLRWAARHQAEITAKAPGRE